MANYYGFARTNYFHVKDLPAFKAELAPIAVEVVDKGIDARLQREDAEDGLICVLSHDDGGWPSEYLNDNDEIIEIDIADIIARHMIDDEVAIGMEIGYEKLRYLIGYAWAVNSKGETRSVSLNDSILELAKQLGTHVTGVDH